MYAAHPAPHHPDTITWRHPRHYLAASLPGSVRRWLLDPGSLTRHLIAASDNQFRVELLGHRWQRPLASERRLLRMGMRDRGIVREVILRCHDQPWVFARSVIPARSLRGPLRRLRKFSDSSLGELLFREPGMHRGPFEVAQIDAGNALLPAALRRIDQAGRATLWGRRCRFEIAGKPILVSEIFLPAFQPAAMRAARY